MRPSEARMDHAQDLLSRLLACERYDKIPGAILKPLTDRLGAQTASFREFEHIGSRLSIGSSCCHGVALSSHSQYASYFHKLDPVMHYGVRPRGRLNRLSSAGFDLFRLADICDYDRLMRTEYYQDFFRPNHIHHVLVLAFRLFEDDDRVTLLGFHRPPKAPRFTRREMAAARQIAPGVLAVLRSLALSDTLRQKRQVIRGLEAATGDTGVVLLDHHGRVLYTNQHNRLLSRTAAPTDQKAKPESQALMMHIQQVCRQLDKAKPAPQDDGEAVPEIRHFTTTDGTPLILRSMPIAHEDGDGAFLVTVGQGDLDTGAMGQRLAGYGLTRREREIAGLIVQGSSNKEISRSLGISVRTTENHLRSIYAKTGVHTRSQLAFRLCIQTN